MVNFPVHTTQLNHDEINYLNISITPNALEAVTKLPFGRSPDPDSFSTQCYHTFKEKFMPLFLKSFRHIETERIPFMKSVTLKPKPYNNLEKKENCRLISLVSIIKKIFSMKYLQTKTKLHFKESICHDQVGIIPNIQG